MLLVVAGGRIVHVTWSGPRVIGDVRLENRDRAVFRGTRGQIDNVFDRDVDRQTWFLAFLCLCVPE